MAPRISTQRPAEGGRKTINKALNNQTSSKKKASRNVEDEEE